MTEAYGKREQFGRIFSDNILLGDKGDSFFNLPLNEQVDKLAWSEACPVKNSVISGRGLEKARERYAEIIFARKMIWEEAKKHNTELYQSLIQSIPRNPNEPVGTHEPNSVPESHRKIINPNATPWGYSLPRMLLDQFGKRSIRTDKRIQTGLEILEDTVKNTHSPLEFTALLAERLTAANANVDEILKSTVSKGYLDEENTRQLYREFSIELKRHSPTLWRRYSELDPQTRDRFGIAEIPEL